MTTKISIWVTPQVFDDAKSAFLADFDTLPADQAQDTFAKWVARALDLHAARTPKERTGLEAERNDDGKSGPRSFTIPQATMAALEAALVDDRRAGRVTSRSQFAFEALKAATEEARQRNGGALPPAPARLPNAPLAR